MKAHSLNQSLALVAREQAQDYAEVVELWQRRFGHSNRTAIKRMAKQEAVTGLDQNAKPLEQVKCPPCAMGKKSRLSLRARTLVPKRPQKVILTDIYGPLPGPSIGGNRYFVTFSDVQSTYK